MSENESDNDCIAFALDMRANYIETGDVTLCREDVIRMAQSIKSSNKDFEARKRAEMIEKLKPLSDDQKDFVARLRELAKRIGHEG